MTESLRDLLSELHVDDPEKSERRLESYLELIQHYGRRTNLVGNLDEAFIRYQLIGGSLQILRVARPSGHLIDVGSGAGLPGLPLALVLPNLKVRLVEPRKKRAAFLRQAIQLLEAGQVEVVQSEVRKITDTYDWATARAFKPPSIWLEIGLALVRPGGSVACYTTRRAWGEATLPETARISGIADDPTGEGRVVAIVEKKRRKT